MGSSPPLGPKYIHWYMAKLKSLSSFWYAEFWFLVCRSLVVYILYPKLPGFRAVIGSDRDPNLVLGENIKNAASAFSGAYGILDVLLLCYLLFAVISFFLRLEDHTLFSS